MDGLLNSKLSALDLSRIDKLGRFAHNSLLAIRHAQKNPLNSHGRKTYLDKALTAFYKLRFCSATFDPDAIMSEAMPQYFIDMADGLEDGCKASPVFAYDMPSAAAAKAAEIAEKTPMREAICRELMQTWSGLELRNLWKGASAKYSRWAVAEMQRRNPECTTGVIETVWNCEP